MTSVASQMVYVELLEEGTKVFRPVAAEHIEGMKYRILESPPDDETWPLLRGDVVTVQWHKFVSGEAALLAVERAGLE